MAEQVLQSARITFILPQGDDKDTDTAVNVFVTTRFNGQFDLMLASKTRFADTDTWEDDGQHSYTYSLNVVPIKLSQIDSNVKTTITIEPNGNDTVKFGYRLELFFDDGDPNTAQIVLSQARQNITLSHDMRTFVS